MKAKTKLKLSEGAAVAYVIFWLSETIFFLIRDGWHWKATTPEELLCDIIATLMFLFSIIMFVSLLLDVVRIHVAMIEMGEKAIKDRTNDKPIMPL